MARIALHPEVGRLAVCAVAALAALLLPELWRMPTIFVWNSSSSVPEGLYAVRHVTRLRRGDLVVGWAPSWARDLASRRRYLPFRIPIVKPIAAIGGDLVCARGSFVLINGKRAARRLRSDTARRPLPQWEGCRRLRAGTYLLLAPASASFDGRYFGTSLASDIIGRAVRLWPR